MLYFFDHSGNKKRVLVLPDYIRILKLIGLRVPVEIYDDARADTEYINFSLPFRVFSSSSSVCSVIQSILLKTISAKKPIL